MRRALALFGLVCGIWMATCPAPAAENGGQPAPTISSLPPLPEAIHDALADRRFEQAIELIDELLDAEGADRADYLLYLRGRAETALERFPAALETFASIEANHPQSAWLTRARFGRAEVYARQRDYPKAGEIYRAEAERLLSAGRRDALADVTLEFANRHFEGVPADDPAAEPEPDYQQALLYFAEALKLNPSTSVRQTIELRMARSHQELGEHEQAIKGYRDYLRRYAGETTPEERRAPSADEAAVRFQLGRTLLAANKHAEARRTWQDLLALPALTEAAPDLQSEAMFELAHTHGVPAPASIADLELGIATHEQFLAEFREHERAARAELEMAQSYVKHARYDRAITRLRPLIENPAYADSDEVAEARRLLGQSYYAQKKFTEAIAAWKDFLERHPSHAAWSKVQRAAIDAEFEAAAEERRLENHGAARKLWETFLNKYPLDARAPQILLAFGRMKVAEAVARQKKAAPDEELSPEVRRLCEEAIADWKRLVSKYPEGEESSQAALLIGVTLEDRLHRLADALEAYQQVKGGSEETAKKRINRLTAKQLELATERKYRSNEPAVVRLRTRNIEQVSVSVYRIDMVDYFRKMHLASGVENLDIALIDPDSSWEYSIPDYEPYRRLTQDVEIPVDEPGISAVTVSGENLQATTMVIVSDLDVVVKCSRNELFVFVENMLTQEPAGDVQLLISDGSEVFAEQTTGPDGVLQKSIERLKDIDDLRVFAVAAGHTASSVTNLKGLDFAVGLAPKGYLYTDRPAYRAGQLVHLKGIVRWVEEDRYVFQEGEQYRLEVYDPRGRAVHGSEVALDAFGAFADHFILPEAAAPGGYRVHLHQPGEKQSYETTFQVHEVQLQPVRLAVDLPRRVYYRGETIEGEIRLEYYYGTPLADREVHYRLASGPRQTARTDSEGKITFQFETQEFHESQTLALAVEYPERNLSVSEKLHLATREFAIHVASLRNVYIAGETFDVTVRVADPLGNPVATGLALEAFEQTEVGSKKGERRIEQHELASDEETGEVRHTLRIDRAGRYYVRATGTDRFGNTISGQKTIIISGEEDEIRLRILAEKQHYNLGDTARVQLHWREDPALALVTYEGAHVLGYRLVELATGANRLEIPLESQLAPNFRLAVCVMQGDRFHEAHSEIRVARRLQIAMKPEKTKLGPGEELEVEIVVTDLQGNPVSAELSLGLVQQNLFAYFGDVAGRIDEFFGSGERKPALRATTSCTFRYRPKTRPVNAALLAEAERERLADMEAAALESHMFRNLTSAGMSDSIRGFEFSGRGGAGGALGTNRYRADYGEYVQNYNRLLQLGRFDEAGVVAQQLEELAPDHPLSETLKQQAELYERFAAGDAVVDFDAGQDFSFYVPLSRGEAARSQLARLYRSSGGDMPLGWGQPQVEFQDGAWAFVTDLNANGEIAEFESSLSLFVTQNQSLDGPAAAALSDDLSRLSLGVVALNGRGEFQAVDALSQEALADFGASGIEILPEMATAETGYWNPVIVTGADGKAELSFHLPQRSTAWNLAARGADAEALAGQTEVEIVASKELFGDLKTPLAFYEGDRGHVIAEIHNAVVAEGESIEVVLRATAGDRTLDQRKSVASTGPGIIEVEFPVEVAEVGAIEFELSVSAGERSDTHEVTVPVRPYGLPVFATAGGSAVQSTIALVEHDQTDMQNPELEVLIGPTINRTLIDCVLGSGLNRFEAALVTPRHGLERAVSDVLGGVALLKTIGDSQSDGSPEAASITGKVHGSVALLVTAQRDDGGWSWSGRASAPQPDRYLSSRVVWALATARRAGFTVPAETFDQGVQFLRTAFTQTAQAERETQAILLHGLAEAGAGEFALANRLYRERNSLSASGLIHLALVLIEMDRKEMAHDLLDLVDLPLDDALAQGRAKDAALARCPPWMQTSVELRALYLLAVGRLDPSGKLAETLAEWLLAARRGARWTPEKANGPAVAALADWLAHGKAADEQYTLTVSVNGKLVEELMIDPAADPTQRIGVPSELLVDEGPQTINFEMQGRGRFSYSAVLGGFVPADQLAATTQDWTVRRYYEPAPRMLDGREIPRGFSLAERYQRFRNPLTQLPLAERGEVTLDVDRRNVRGAPEEQFDYLVVIEPIPSGAVVLRDSIQGDFERYELAPGAITFFVGDKAYPGEIHYALVGYLPGAYRAAPCVVRSFYRPEKIAVAAPKPLEMLPRGAETQDEYRLTPVELFEFGKRYHARGDHAEASQHLTELLADWQLKEKVYEQAVRMLFSASLALGADDAIVKYFEIIKERYPEVEIDYESILRVAAAYRELGEYERSYLVFRATVEGRFQRESQIAGFLDRRGEFLRSVQFVESLLRDYPAESYIATASYSLAVEVYGKASTAGADQKLVERRITRVDLIAASIRMLKHFLSTWPNDPAADQASFSLASGLLDLEQYERVIEQCGKFAERYPESRLLDGFWYVIGFSQFALSRHEQALEMCRKVAEWTRKNPRTGLDEEASNKWQAIYIMGQVYHSLGQAAEAIDEYQRVQERFADAAEAIEFFTRKAIKVPEVTTVRPGQPAEVELEFRNVASAGVKVYRIDLLKFGLIQRNLNEITAINLAGIRPYHALDLDLGDGKDYRDRRQTLKLPLEEEGAYLVVCRGENLYTSGLVLVSPIELAVQEDAVSGRVRVTVKDSVENRYLRDIQVKVIGTNNEEFVSGETDLRGIFVADAIQGRTTVIARADEGRYAFFRGRRPLRPRQPEPPSNAAAGQQGGSRVETAPQSSRELLLENVRGANGVIMQEQRDNYRTLIENEDMGVKAKAAY